MPPVLIAPEFKLPVLAVPLAERVPLNIALAPFTLPEALILPGVEILPFTLALLKMLPLKLSCTAFTVPPLVMLPPRPATLLNERLNPPPKVTSPAALIEVLCMLPLSDKLEPLM